MRGERGGVGEGKREKGGGGKRKGEDGWQGRKRGRVGEGKERKGKGEGGGIEWEVGREREGEHFEWK